MPQDMEQVVATLKSLVRFKDSTSEGDIVLIVAAAPENLGYALVTGFARDISRRDEWYHVTLQLLGIPPQEVVWTLRPEQFTGMEIFTMGGEKRFIKAVDFTPPPPKPAEKTPLARKKAKSLLRVVK